MQTELCFGYVFFALVFQTLPMVEAAFLSHPNPVPAYGTSFRGYMANSVAQPELLEDGRFSVPSKFSHPGQQSSSLPIGLDRADQKFLQSHPSIGVQLLSEYKRFCYGYQGPHDLSLSSENRYGWFLLSEQFWRLEEHDQEALEGWVKQGFEFFRRRFGESDLDEKFEEAREKIDWQFRRAASLQPIWWNSDDVARWNEKNLDTNIVTTLGDILRFDKKSPNYVIGHSSTDLVRALINFFVSTSKINSPSENKAYFFKKAHSWKNSRVASEIDELRSFQENHGEKPLYYARVRQVLDEPKERVIDLLERGERIILYHLLKFYDHDRERKVRKLQESRPKKVKGESFVRVVPVPPMKKPCPR